MTVACALVLSGVLDWAVGAPVLGYSLLCLTGFVLAFAIYTRETLSSYRGYAETRYQISK